MSTDFYIKTDLPFEMGVIPIADFMDAIYEVEEICFSYPDEFTEDLVINKSQDDIKNKIDTGSSILIVSDNDHLWVNHHEGLVTSFERRGCSDVCKILNIIEEYVGITLWTDSGEYTRRTPLEQEQWWNAIGRHEEEGALIFADPSCQLGWRSDVNVV